MDKEKVYYIFGDSIMKGVMPDEDMNYHSSEAIGFGELESRHGVKIVNYAMPTFTSAQVCSWAYRTMERAADPDFIFLEFGGNDCDYRWKEICARTCPKDELHRISPEEFEKNYRGLIEFFIGRGVKPVIVTCPRIDVERYLKHLMESGVTADILDEYMISLEKIGSGFEQYLQIMKKLSLEYGTGYLSLDDNFPKEGGRGHLFSADGMHPNEAGYALFHESFDKWLTEQR